MQWLVWAVRTQPEQTLCHVSARNTIPSARLQEEDKRADLQVPFRGLVQHQGWLHSSWEHFGSHVTPQTLLCRLGEIAGVIHQQLSVMQNKADKSRVQYANLKAQWASESLCAFSFDLQLGDNASFISHMFTRKSYSSSFKYPKFCLIFFSFQLHQGYHVRNTRYRSVKSSLGLFRDIVIQRFKCCDHTEESHEAISFSVVILVMRYVL